MAVQERHDQYHGGPAGSSLKQHPQVPLHLCWHGTQVVLHLVPQTGQKQGGNCHPSLYGALPDGDCM